MAYLSGPSIASAQDCHDTEAIAWKVEGGFAVFKGQEAREAGDRLLDEIAAKHGRLSTDLTSDPASAYGAIVDALVKRTLADGSQLFEHTYWDRTAEHYTDRGELLTPAMSYVRASFPGSTARDCTWTVGGQVIVAGCIDARLPIARDTASHGLQAAVAVTDAVGRHVETCLHIEERLIVGLGDSYASGEGNPDRPTRWNAIPAVEHAGRNRLSASKIDALWYRNERGPLRTVPHDADAQWWDNSCHRSLLSQQALAAMAYAAATRHRQVAFLSFACSGATVIDGIVGPRFEAPGASRKLGTDRPASTPLSQSQLQQAQGVLCAEPPHDEPLTISPTMRFWHALRHADGTPVATPMVPVCAGPLRKPDAIVLSVGGNDIGFGGVGFWAIVPPVDRGLLPIDLVTRSSITADRKAAKRDFGLVCPDRYDNEKRCRKSAFTAQDLLGELPEVLRYMDQALEKSHLSAPIKIQMSYPPVARDERGELCGDLWAAWTGTRYEAQNEPWMPLYGEVLDTLRLGRLTPAALRGPWSFGIFNTASEADCANHLEDHKDQTREMCIIERDVYNKLNTVVANHAGWTVLSAARLPDTHGLCAASSKLGDLVAAQKATESKAANAAAIRDLARREFGWPRWRKGWNEAWPAPQEWEPYAPRPRWFRTATDSALTQSVFDGGTLTSARPRGARNEALRHDENASGTIHPALQMHAAMAELIAAALEHPET